MKAARHSGLAVRKSAFTLIELLVVIAIIAILAAILFPVFAQAREKARQTSCLSNLKQLNMGFMMYAQDYDETFPVWHWADSHQGAAGASRDNMTSFWVCAIFPYVKNQGVYYCPSDVNKYGLQNNGWWSANAVGLPTGLTMTMPISYGMNEYMHNEKPSIAAMGSPANIFVIADSATQLSGYAGVGDPTQLIPRIAAPKGQPCWTSNGGTGTYWETSMPAVNATNRLDSCSYHSGGNNIGYADGHVKYRKLKQITGDLAKPADY